MVAGPRFFIDDPNAALHRALVAAFRDARTKAAALAAEAGLTLVQTIIIRESTFVPSDSDLVGFDEDGGGGGGQEQGRRVAAPTEPGRTQVFGTVYVVFETG